MTRPPEFSPGENILRPGFREKLNSWSQFAFGSQRGGQALHGKPRVRLFKLKSGQTWSASTTGGVTDDVNSALCEAVYLTAPGAASNPNEYAETGAEERVYNSLEGDEPGEDERFMAVWNEQSGRWEMLFRHSCISASNTWDDDFSSSGTLSSYSEWDQLTSPSASWSISGGQLSGSSLATATDSISMLYQIADLSMYSSIDDMGLRIAANVPGAPTAGAEPAIFYTALGTGATNPNPFTVAPFNHGRALTVADDGFGTYRVYNDTLEQVAKSGGWVSNIGVAGSSSGTLEIVIVGRNHSKAVAPLPTAGTLQVQEWWAGTRLGASATTGWDNDNCAVQAGVFGFRSTSRSWNSFSVEVDSW